MAVSNSPIKVFLVDDHKVVRAGVRQFLDEAGDIKVVGEAATGADAIIRAPELETDVVLLDLRLPDCEGFDVCRAIKQKAPATRVLVLTSYLDEETVLKTIASGVDGYLLKEIDGADLADAVRKVAKGETALDDRVARSMMTRVKVEPNPLDKLSSQEKKLLSLVAKGMTNKEVGSEMGLGDGTVRNYLSALMNKLDVTRRSEAVAMHFKHATGKR